MNPSFELIEGAFGLRLGDADLTAARRLLLDHVGVVARGAERPSARAAQELAAAAPASGPSLPVIGSKLRAPALAVGDLVVFRPREGGSFFLFFVC